MKIQAGAGFENQAGAFMIIEVYAYPVCGGPFYWVVTVDGRLKSALVLSVV